MFRKYAKNSLRLGGDVKACKDCRGPERPCLVDGRPATFHRWVEEDRGVLQINALLREEAVERVRRDFQEKHIIPPGATLEKLRGVRALVEWPDGSVGTVDLGLLTFLDRREG